MVVTASSTRAGVNLTFHGIGQPSRHLQAGEDAVWMDVPEFESVLDAVVGRDDVRLTFDDGNISDLNHALPALRERGLLATFFVVAGRIGTAGSLDEDDIHTLAAEGMTIGGHGMLHQSWRDLSDSELHAELVVSKRELEGLLGCSVTEAACPFGRYDRRVLRKLRAAGYQRVFTSDGGPAAFDAWMQARNTIGRGDAANLDTRILSQDGRRARALARRVKVAVKQWR